MEGSGSSGVCWTRGQSLCEGVHIGSEPRVSDSSARVVESTASELTLARMGTKNLRIGLVLTERMRDGVHSELTR